MLEITVDDRDIKFDYTLRVQGYYIKQKFLHTPCFIFNHHLGFNVESSNVQSKHFW